MFLFFALPSKGTSHGYLDDASNIIFPFKPNNNYFERRTKNKRKSSGDLCVNSMKSWLLVINLKGKRGGGRVNYRVSAYVKYNIVKHNFNIIKPCSFSYMTLYGIDVGHFSHSSQNRIY